MESSGISYLASLHFNLHQRAKTHLNFNTVCLRPYVMLELILNFYVYWTRLLYRVFFCRVFLFTESFLLGIRQIASLPSA